MSKPKSGPQDLPPKGGYAPYQIDRVKLRSLISGRLGLGIFITANVIGIPLYRKNWVENRKRFLEQKSAELAALPILLAEKDRTLLKHMKRLRELETDVMKNFPHWEVGTLFGTPVYETLPNDTYVEPLPFECYIYGEMSDIPLQQFSFMIT